MTISADTILDHGPLGNANRRRQLGRSETVGTLAGAARRQVLVYAGSTQRGNKRAVGDAAASALTITCTYDSENPANVVRPLSILGTIRWGQDGHQAVAQFDWRNGQVVQVSASFVEVIAELREVESAAEVSPSDTVDALARAGAFVGYMSASRAPATLTQQVRVGPSQQVFSEIPAFATALRVYYATTPLTCTWCIGPSLPYVLAPVDATLLDPRANYLRPGIATHLGLSLGAAASGLYTLVWTLSI